MDPIKISTPRDDFTSKTETSAKVAQPKNFEGRGVSLEPNIATTPKVSSEFKKAVTAKSEESVNPPSLKSRKIEISPKGTDSTRRATLPLLSSEGSLESSKAKQEKFITLAKGARTTEDYSQLANLLSKMNNNDLKAVLGKLFKDGQMQSLGLRLFPHLKNEDRKQFLLCALEQKKTEVLHKLDDLPFLTRLRIRSEVNSSTTKISQDLTQRYSLDKNYNKEYAYQECMNSFISGLKLSKTTDYELNRPSLIKSFSDDYSNNKQILLQLSSGKLTNTQKAALIDKLSTLLDEKFQQLSSEDKAKFPDGMEVINKSRMAVKEYHKEFLRKVADDIVKADAKIASLSQGGNKAELEAEKKLLKNLVKSYMSHAISFPQGLVKTTDTEVKEIMERRGIQVDN